MRRMILVLTVLAFAMPALAGVTITAVNEGIQGTEPNQYGQVRIDYASDANVSAFALEVELSDGARVNDVNDYFIGECNGTSQGFGIFLDQTNGIVINSAGVPLSYGRPVVHPSSPDGTGTGLRKSKIILEMGALYEEGNQPDLSGTLCRIRYDSCNECTMTISANATRGNVVLETASEAVTNLPVVLTGLADTNDPCCVVVTDVPVPDVTGMLQADAEAALTAAGLTTGSVSTQASAEPDTEVLSQDPVATTMVPPGTSVDLVVSDYECYFGQADYADWVAVDKPECWCYPRQCHGDADGLKYGSVWTGYYYVGTPDLGILADGWMIKDPTKGPGLTGNQGCGDFDHLKYGSVWTGYYRVGTPDLGILANYWMVKEPTKGPGVPGDCLPGNETP